MTVLSLKHPPEPSDEPSADWIGRRITGRYKWPYPILILGVSLIYFGFDFFRRR